MRSERNHKPRWYGLNLIVVLTVVGLVLAHGLSLSPAVHKVILFLIILVTYSLMAGWIRSNEAALENLDREGCRKQSRDPAMYGTPVFPTRTQAHYRGVLSFYHHEATHKR